MGSGSKSRVRVAKVGFGSGTISRDREPKKFWVFPRAFGYSTPSLSEVELDPKVKEALEIKILDHIGKKCALKK